MQALKYTVQALKYRALGVLAVAAASLAALSTPAWAANGPPRVGCTTGSSCIVELNWNVTYTGSTGGHNGVVITPPPCIGVPIGDAHTGSQAIISLYSDTNALPSQSPAPLDSTSPAESASPTGTGPSDSAAPSSSATVSASPSATATTTASTAALILSSAPVLSGPQQAILDQAEQLVGSNPITPGEWYQISGNPTPPRPPRQSARTCPRTSG